MSTKTTKAYRDRRDKRVSIDGKRHVRKDEIIRGESFTRILRYGWYGGGTTVFGPIPTEQFDRLVGLA